MSKYLIVNLFLLLSVVLFNGSRIKDKRNKNAKEEIITGANQTEKYLPMLKGKRVGLLVNQTSMIGEKPIVDSLLSIGINVVKIFGPEHGFRSNASNGAKIKDEVDSITGIPIVSLYGNKRKPSKQDLDSIDIMIFDIQDVGCRFYTNINKLYDVMEACAEFGKDLLILDRPNPNAYIDGPVLDMKLKSGIGKFPIPIAHGLTIGEFAQMINGEKWLPNNLSCTIKIIPVQNYNHNMYYELPVKPSPNLNSQQSIMLYPSLCLFEGTIISQGRGTYWPFTVLGSPDLKDKYDFSFTPMSIPGMSETPLHQNKKCYGLDLRNFDTKQLFNSRHINLSWLTELYKIHPQKHLFFDKSISNQIGDFDKLAGTTKLKQQIIDQVSIEEIRNSWEPELSNYKKMTKKYLLYP